MTLGEWQSHLKEHFQALRQSRPGGEPIFALEHGLDAAELGTLTADIKEDIAKAQPSGTHALPWIVYAAEIGYLYAGDQYWRTFTQQTPGWEVYGEPELIRRFFRIFHERFGGAAPSGPWARQFSIICWPITHAILPQDLQCQLAKALHDMRDLFSPELLASPEAIGMQIAARSWNATARFQNLAEEPRLIGQIAKALLLQDVQGSDSLILSSTLRRIRENLDGVRAARDWLRGAQRLAQQRVQFRGLSSGRVPSADPGPPTHTELAREQVAALAIEPRLILRPSSVDSWDVRLEMPDLSHLIDKFPALRSVLTKSRCVVAGSSGRWLASGALLHGPQFVTLRSWPNLSEVLLRFEQAVPPELEFLLRAECLLRPGSRWLFRVGPDGQAYEVRGNLVRPGQTYVMASLVGASAPFKPSPEMRLQRLACEGIHGVLFKVPTPVTKEWSGRLRELGLSQARSVHVWPAGLAAASWDGEGRGEWLTTERPCIGIRPDHAVHAITLALGRAKARRLDIVSSEPGAPIFIELPPLSVGVHALRVTTHSARAPIEEQSGGLDIVIRAPRAWDPGVCAPDALRISVDPPTPTLEQIWEGRATIEIRGPIGRQITPTITLFERNSPTPNIRRLPPLAIPADARVWRAHFEKHFRRANDVQNLYESAHVGQIDLNAEELGELSLTCEREFSPLRWVVRRNDGGYELSLIDDTGSQDPPAIIRYEFTAPDTPVRMPLAPFLIGYSAPPDGALYTARTGGCERAVILSPIKSTFYGLNAEPKVRAWPRSIDAVEELLSLIRMWWEARLAGLLSVTKRQRVILSLLQEVFSILGGKDWANVERASRATSGAAALEALKRAISSKAPGTSLAAKLFMDYPDYIALNTSERMVRFASTTRRLLQLAAPAPSHAPAPGAEEMAEIPQGSRPQDANWICEFALRLASAPETLQKWAGASLRRGVERLRDRPELARAARFLILAVEPDPTASVSDYHIYRTWRWE